MCAAASYSELKAKLRTAPPGERPEGAKEFDEHQVDQMRDRQVYYRMWTDSMSGEVLTIMQDGSGQAKYRTVSPVRPRSSTAWCPQLLPGCLMEEDVQRSRVWRRLLGKEAVVVETLDFGRGAAGAMSEDPPPHHEISQPRLF
jgi:hypothetical protein